MDQFSHDLTVALEETSLLDRAHVGRWGQQRRRTRSTGNLPCAPQPTEDSSSPTDAAQGSTIITSTTNNNDGLDTHNINLPISDSDDKDNDALDYGGTCLPHKSQLIYANNVRLGALESDSVNETFSPARFFKPNARRKRKLKRTTMDYEVSPHNAIRSDNSSIVTTTIMRTTSGINSSSALRHSTNATTIPTATTTTVYSLPTSTVCSAGTIRKRLLRTDSSSRSQMFFCGKRKRSNRDRYHEHGAGASGLHNDHSIISNCTARNVYHNNNNNNSINSRGINNNNYNSDELYIRPRSFSSTSTKPHSDRLLPLNEGLLSKIERISQQQQVQQQKTLPSLSFSNEKSVRATFPRTKEPLFNDDDDDGDGNEGAQLMCNVKLQPKQQHQSISSQYCDESLEKLNLKGQQQHLSCCNNRHQQHRHHHHNHGNHKYHHHQRQRRRLLQFPIDDTNLMDCENFNEFSSSSISSSESDDNHATNDTDREGDDELTDWPGNEFNGIGGGGKGIDYKRKLTKRSILPQIKSDPESLNALIMIEDDTLINQGPNISINNTGSVGGILWPPSSSIENTPPKMDLPYQTSEPIAIINSSNILLSTAILDEDKRGIDSDYREKNLKTMTVTANDISIPFKQIESEMSGETSTNPFLSSSPPHQIREIREIRAGCRRVKGERPGFSIKTSVNERLARFLQDPRQMQIRLPDIEIYEHDSLINLATLYSLHMSLDNGCAVLNKTSNTTQSVNIDQDLQNRLLLSDFKRRCYETETPPHDLLPK